MVRGLRDVPTEGGESERRIMIIEVRPDTTPQQALDMAHSFAQALRKTGWALIDEGFAQSLWVDREYSQCAVYPYLVAGFVAGYHFDPKPALEDVDTNVDASEGAPSEPRSAEQRPKPVPPAGAGTPPRRRI